MQVHEDMMQIINITDLSAFVLGCVQFEKDALLGIEMFLFFDAQCLRINYELFLN